METSHALCLVRVEELSMDAVFRRGRQRAGAAIYRGFQKQQSQGECSWRLPEREQESRGSARKLLEGLAVA